MAALETLTETVDIGFIQHMSVLISLEEVTIIVDFLRTGGEWNQHANVMGLSEVAQCLNLFGIEWANNQVAVSSLGVF